MVFVYRESGGGANYGVAYRECNYMATLYWQGGNAGSDKYSYRGRLVNVFTNSDRYIEHPGLTLISG